MRVTNHSIRERASYQVKVFLGRIIMLNLAVMLISSVLSGAGFWFSVDSGTDAIVELFEELEFTDDPDAAFEELGRLFSEEPESLLELVKPNYLLSTVSFLVMSFVTTGFTYAMIRMADGEAVKCSILFSRWKHVLGSVGLPLWVGLKTMVWIIPGYLVMGLGISITPSSLSGRALLIYELAVVAISVILMLVLVIPAHFRYAMATYAFAGTPEMGVYDAVEYSKSIMVNRKWSLFCLNIPYALAIVAIWFVIVLLMTAFLYIGFVAITVYVMLLLLLAAVLGTIYLRYLATMAKACFYNAHKN